MLFAVRVCACGLLLILMCVWPHVIAGCCCVALFNIVCFLLPLLVFGVFASCFIVASL